MDRLTVRNMRNWGEVWLGTELWDRLGLDGFWSSRLPPSRKGTDWLAIILDRLGLTLPAQPPPKISGDLAETAKTEV